jgi:hypothetical protein
MDNLSDARTLPEFAVLSTSVPGPMAPFNGWLDSLAVNRIKHWSIFNCEGDLTYRCKFALVGHPNVASAYSEESRRGDCPGDSLISCTDANVRSQLHLEFVLPHGSS